MRLVRLVRGGIVGATAWCVVARVSVRGLAGSIPVVFVAPWPVVSG